MITVQNMQCCALLTFQTAASEGITDISRQTGTDGVVVDDATLGVEATDSGTGIDTVLVDTGEAGDAVAVDDTLRSAAAVGVAEVVWPAATDTGAAPHLSVSIGTTGVGIAGISWWWRS